MNDVDKPLDVKKSKHGKITEKQCPKCEKWYDKRGYKAHNIFCTEKPPEDDDQKGHAHAHTQDRKNQPQTLDLTPDKITCPECGNENITGTQGPSQIYRNNGHHEQAKELNQYENFCPNCYTAFNDNEAQQ